MPRSRGEVLFFLAASYALISSMSRWAWRAPATSSTKKSPENILDRIRFQEGRYAREFWVTSIVTFAIVGASLYIILSRCYDDATQKWAIGAVSGISGYWFRSIRSRS